MLLDDESSAAALVQAWAPVHALLGRVVVVGLVAAPSVVGGRAPSVVGGRAATSHLLGRRHLRKDRIGGVLDTLAINVNFHIEFIKESLRGPLYSASSAQEAKENELKATRRPNNQIIFHVSGVLGRRAPQSTRSAAAEVSPAHEGRQSSGQQRGAGQMEEGNGEEEGRGRSVSLK